MAETAQDLRQLKGIGRILVKRLQDAGLDSFEKIAQAGEEELKKIGGINPHSIPSILEQANQLAEAAHPEQKAGVEALLLRLTEVKLKVQALAETTRERFQEELAGKLGKKLATDLVRVEDSLKSIKLKGKKSARRAGKALNKVEKRFAGLAGDATLKKVRKTLKRARKAVKKAAK
jgi:nucleotidyltransferase/DNA polymerase involved in DNA repair